VISLARIDERLVHGQVLVGWVPHLGAQRVVVADDEASASPLARAAMTLALPPGVEAEVVPVASVDWGALAGSSEPVLVVLRGIAAAEKALVAGLTPERCPVLNLGNVHYAEGRRAITPSVFLSEAELAGLRRLGAAGFQVEVRAVPLDAPIGLTEIERRWGAAG
jgi:PTS system mannose-specific IIB component